MKKFISFPMLLFVLVTALSQELDKNLAIDTSSGDTKNQLSRIQADRRREEGKYQTEERACHVRFAVTDCLREVRVRRREALDELRRQEIAVNDVDRQRSAREQIERIQEKSSVQRIEEDVAYRLDVEKAYQEHASRKTPDARNQKSSRGVGQPAQKLVGQSRSKEDIAKEKKQYVDKLKEAEDHRANQINNKQKKSGVLGHALPTVP